MKANNQNNKNDLKILILAPIGRDAELTVRFLNEDGLHSEICSNINELAQKLTEPAGVVFLTGEALVPETISILIQTLQNQPPWSDIPLIVLTSGGGDNPTNSDTLAELSMAGNVTLIERPVRMMTLKSAINSALRARRKQYEARDFLLSEIRSKEELRKSEKMLQNARQRLESTLSAAEVGTWTWDYLNNKVYADKNLARMFSVDAKDANGGQIEKYLMSIHPEDRERVSQIIERAIKSKREYQAEYRLITQNGGISWVIARGIIERDSAGQAISLPGVIVDISDRRMIEEELRESEERYRYLFNSIDEGFCVIEVLFNDEGKPFDYRFLEINQMFVQQSGLKDAVGKTMLELVPNHDKHWFELYGKVALTGEPVRIENGAEALNRWFDLYAFRVGKSESKKVAVLFKDITKRKLEENERENLLKSTEEARKIAEEANRLKDEFLAVVSHELRTPLNSILGWSQMYRQKSLDSSEIKQAFTIIERNARLQNQLIEDLLDVSRIISGKVRLDIKPIKLNEVIDATLESIKPAAEARQITLETKFDNNIPLIMGDFDRLQQIIWNLLSNAIKFTQPLGKVEIYLSQLNSHFEITVKDTGKGIEQNFIPFVFDRFRQADSSSKRQYSGLGLGLSIVRQLTELHGGSVEVFSEGESKGSTFKVFLPLPNKHGLPDNQDISKSKLNGYLNELTKLKDAKILLVEDDDDTRDLLSLILEQRLAQVKAVSNVNDAISMFELENFDILISDIEMPRKDGYDLIKSIRAMKKNSDIPAIALTAYARTEDKIKALESGFNIHFPKPIVDSEKLIKVVEKLINSK